MQGPEIFSGFPSYFGICHFQSVFLLSIINNSHNETYFGKQENKNQLTATYSPQTTCPGGRQELSLVAFHRLKAVLKSTLWVVTFLASKTAALLSRPGFDPPQTHL